MQRPIIFLLICLAALGGCSSGGRTLDPETLAIFSAAGVQPEAEVKKYEIGPGDVLSVNVWRNPELSLNVPVRPDGFISMPLIGDIQASGFNAEELAAEITRLLESQLRNPQVTVVVTQVNSGVYDTRVRVTGAVRNPLSLPYSRGMSVLDVILEAGGVTEVAAADRARLYRTIENELYDVQVNLEDILLRGRLDTNYMLRPGDVLTVPERLF